MNDFRAVVQTHLEKNRLIPDASLPLIIGLSGGADSVALLHVLVDLGYTCRPAHCNFQLRGEESERDEQFAMARAHALGLPIETIRFDTSQYAREHKLSIEMAARELRYRWFEELRLQHRAAHIAVGHHADDNIETVLLNLIRGTGLKGLTGMQAANGYVIRPLLGVNRQDILEYLQQERLPFIEDSSNAASDYTRNKIRNRLIPMIQTINPSFTDGFRDTIQHLNSSYVFQQKKVAEIKSLVADFNHETCYISITKFLEAGGDEFILYELLNEFNFNKTHVKKIFASIGGISGKQFYSPTHSLLKDRDLLHIRPLHTPDNNRLPRISCRCFVPDKDFSVSTDPWVAHLDGGMIQHPLSIRPWKTGDYFYPLGLNRKKKISDLFIDLKIDRNKKQSIYVVTTHTGTTETIVWVPGIRIDHRFRVTDATSEIAEIRLLR